MITRRLVDLMGGSISFETELDKGTTFKVSIPVETSQKNERNGAWSGHHANQPIQGSRIHCRVLVVDDRPEMRSLFAISSREPAAAFRLPRTAARQSKRSAVQRPKAGPLMSS